MVEATRNLFQRLGLFFNTGDTEAPGNRGYQVS